LSTRCRAAKFIFVSTDDDISVEEKLDTDKEDKQFSDPIRMEKTKELDQVREREREREKLQKWQTSLHFTQSRRRRARGDGRDQQKTFKKPKGRRKRDPFKMGTLMALKEKNPKMT
jgi:hypothetical protein